MQGTSSLQSGKATSLARGTPQPALAALRLNVGMVAESQYSKMRGTSCLNFLVEKGIWRNADLKGDSMSGAEMCIGLDFLLPQQVLCTLEKHNPAC